MLQGGNANRKEESNNKALYRDEERYQTPQSKNMVKIKKAILRCTFESNIEGMSNRMKAKRREITVLETKIKYRNILQMTDIICTNTNPRIKGQ